MQNNFSNKYGKSEEYIPLMFGPQNQYLPPYNPSFQPFPPRNENLQWPQTMQNIEMNSLNNLPHPMQFIRNSTNENEVFLNERKTKAIL